MENQPDNVIGNIYFMALLIALLLIFVFSLFEK